MSNFAEAFAGLLSGVDEYREERIASNMMAFGQTRAEAMIMDEAITEGVQAAGRALGAALDGLNAKLAVDALPAMLDVASKNMRGLELTVAGIVFGEVTPTPNCDCEACECVKAVRREMDAVAAAITAPATRH